MFRKAGQKNSAGQYWSKRLVKHVNDIRCGQNCWPKAMDSRLVLFLATLLPFLVTLIPFLVTLVLFSAQKTGPSSGRASWCTCKLRAKISLTCTPQTLDPRP
eukprot:3940873-Rhodomonas_salina.1